MEHYRKANVPTSGLCFNNRFAWNVGRFYQFNIMEGCVCLYSEGEQDLVGQHLMFPLGELTAQGLKNIVDYYYPLFEERGSPMRIVYTPASHLPLFQNVPGYVTEDYHKIDFDEYVYDAQSLRTFSGKPLHSKKSQLNKFFRECNGCRYETLKKEDAEDCLKLVEDWCLDRGYEKEDLRYSDYLPIQTLFNHMDELDLRGGTIHIFKSLVAFSIGSDILDGTAFIHFEKADHRIAGTNVAIISAVLENEFPEALYVNREEDMGIEGLRIAKQSYNPLWMTEKHDILLTKIQ
jgi:hypothetical protein